MPRTSSQFHAWASYADPRGELAARWYDYELVSYARRDDGFYVGAGRNAGGLTMTFESQMGPGDGDAYVRRGPATSQILLSREIQYRQSSVAECRALEIRFAGAAR